MVQTPPLLVCYIKQPSSVILLRAHLFPSLYKGRSRKRFPLPFWDQRFSPYKVPKRLPRFWASLGGLWGSSGIDHLKSRYSGDRAPITLATLWGVATSPKKEVEISFYSVLRASRGASKVLILPPCTPLYRHPSFGRVGQHHTKTYNRPIESQATGRIVGNNLGIARQIILH